MFAHPGVRGLTARKEKVITRIIRPDVMSAPPRHDSLRSGDLPFNSFASEIRINLLLTRKSH
jgi:hypothetical protein